MGCFSSRRRWNCHDWCVWGPGIYPEPVGLPIGVNVYLSFHTTYPLDEKILLTGLFFGGPEKQSQVVWFLIHIICFHDTKSIHHAGGNRPVWPLFPAPCAHTLAAQKPIPVVSEELLHAISWASWGSGVCACCSDKEAGWYSHRWR